mmetsp:Transcript_1219/g.1387  ORF Transcript_1219/g.1387 Transcript_1219/m.1387 type:complete len:238 (+) Transcript_1219:856-1569(+)
MSYSCGRPETEQGIRLFNVRLRRCGRTRQRRIRRIRLSGTLDSRHAREKRQKSHGNRRQGSHVQAKTRNSTEERKHGNQVVVDEFCPRRCRHGYAGRTVGYTQGRTVRREGELVVRRRRRPTRVGRNAHHRRESYVLPRQRHRYGSTRFFKEFFQKKIKEFDFGEESSLRYGKGRTGEIVWIRWRGRSRTNSVASVEDNSFDTIPTRQRCQTCLSKTCVQTVQARTALSGMGSLCSG